MDAGQRPKVWTLDKNVRYGRWTKTYGMDTRQRRTVWMPDKDAIFTPTSSGINIQFPCTLGIQSPTALPPDRRSCRDGGEGRWVGGGGDVGYKGWAAGLYGQYDDSLPRMPHPPHPLLNKWTAPPILSQVIRQTLGPAVAIDSQTAVWTRPTVR